MTAPTREHWVSVADDGYRRCAVIDFDERGECKVTRELMHELLISVGMRLTLDVITDASDGVCGATWDSHHCEQPDHHDGPHTCSACPAVDS